jgi:hypothetical protein
MDPKPSFDRIFRLTGTHLAAGAVGFIVAALVSAPKPRATALDPHTAQVLELGRQAQAAASASAGPALERAVKLCESLRWPACDPASIRHMGERP